jgi:hypothetical protein
MFEELGRAMYRGRRLVLVLALGFAVFAGVWGTGVFRASRRATWRRGSSAAAMPT